MNRVPTVLLLALLASVPLGGCGRVGMLEQPAPLYGAKAKAEFQARKAAEAQAAAQRREQGAPELLSEPSTTGPSLPPGAVPPPNGATVTPQPQ